ncbi:FeoA family protein [Ruminococcus sp. OA3]|uniref:FeoA family protein n=1 Tax=Ruminococcus sp. OA3 TaxID=2914164 RepID=UPI0023DCEC56|nr:FeoA family protein [Ruminococcus sp. OA3]
MDLRLSQLKPGEKAVVVRLMTSGNMRRRLQDIGLIDGTAVECVGKSPMGDPTAYLIRRAVIALRDEDSRQVRVRMVVQ